MLTKDNNKASCLYMRVCVYVCVQEREKEGEQTSSLVLHFTSKVK